MKKIQNSCNSWASSLEVCILWKLPFFMKLRQWGKIQGQVESMRQVSRPTRKHELKVAASASVPLLTLDQFLLTRMSSQCICTRLWYQCMFWIGLWWLDERNRISEQLKNTLLTSCGCNKITLQKQFKREWTCFGLWFQRCIILYGMEDKVTGTRCCLVTLICIEQEVGLSYNFSKVIQVTYFLQQAFTA